MRSAVLAHFILKEKLCKLGVLGCVMCIAGSVIIVIHAPQEYPITSVLEIWNMATQPGFVQHHFCFLAYILYFSCWLTITISFAVFLLYVGSVIVLVFILVFHFSPRCGHTNVLVYTGICSLMGSLSVSHFDFWVPITIILFQSSTNNMSIPNSFIWTYNVPLHSPCPLAPGGGGVLGELKKEKIRKSEIKRRLKIIDFLILMVGTC